jgi:hypothetical protein
MGCGYAKIPEQFNIEILHRDILQKTYYSKNSYETPSYIVLISKNHTWMAQCFFDSNLTTKWDVLFVTFRYIGPKYEQRLTSDQKLSLLKSFQQDSGWYDFLNEHFALQQSRYYSYSPSRDGIRDFSIYGSAAYVFDKGTSGILSRQQELKDFFAKIDLLSK